MLMQFLVLKLHINLSTFLDVMSPRLLLLSYGWREDVMTHIHVVTNTIISFTVGKHIILEEKKEDVAESNNNIFLLSSDCC
jgi:hypothetical protein